MNVFPTLTPVPFSSASFGSLVLFHGSVAIVSFAQNDPNGTRTLSAFDRSAKKFTDIPMSDFGFGSSVLQIGGERVIEPGIQADMELRCPTRQDSSLLFINGGDAFAVLEITPQINVYGLLNLKTGAVTSMSGNIPMAACTTWQLGVRPSPADSVRWLIEVGIEKAKNASA